MKQLIYLSPVPWNSFAQRPHKFVEWFHNATKGNVLWLDHYPTRFPVISDIRRLLTRETVENDQHPSWLKLIRTPALPIEPMPGSGLLNGFFWKPILQAVEQFIAQEKTIIVMGQPSVLGLKILEQYPNITSVYDAMDDFPSFYSGFSRLAMSWREKKIVNRVTNFMVSSTNLKAHWVKVRSDVKLVPNGLDISKLPIYKKLNRNKESYVFGYVGTIGPWFDWRWVIKLAKNRPDDVVQLIGPLITPSKISLPSNIKIFPACKHEEALQVMQKFDVGLIPFKCNQLTAFVDPIKYYEYRALGLPIISTAFGEMVFRANEIGTFLCHEQDDQNILIQQVLRYDAQEPDIEQFRVKNTWEARFATTNLT